MKKSARSYMNTNGENMFGVGGDSCQLLGVQVGKQ